MLGEVRLIIGAQAPTGIHCAPPQPHPNKLRWEILSQF